MKAKKWRWFLFTSRDLHLFMRFKSIVATHSDLRLYVSRDFMDFLRTQLSVTRCMTLTGRTVDSQMRIDNVDIYIDTASAKPFYIFQ